jgi:hypothetical protein
MIAPTPEKRRKANMGRIVQLFNVDDGSSPDPDYSLQWDDLAKSAAFS